MKCPHQANVAMRQTPGPDPALHANPVGCFDTAETPGTRRLTGIHPAARPNFSKADPRLCWCSSVTMAATPPLSSLNQNCAYPRYVHLNTEEKVPQDLAVPQPKDRRTHRMPCQPARLDEFNIGVTSDLSCSLEISESFLGELYAAGNTQGGFASCSAKEHLSVRVLSLTERRSSIIARMRNRNG